MGKKSKKIKFDEESVTKDNEEFKKRRIEQIKSETEKKQKDNNSRKKGQKKVKRDVFEKSNEDIGNTVEQDGETEKKKSKKRFKLNIENEEDVKTKRSKLQNDDADQNGEEDTEHVDPLTNEIKNKKESKRSQKRKKHQQLMDDKKNQHELSLQQKSLNYLSKWKHTRSEWKFEKLRQIWLMQNMFDSSKIPDEFFDSLLEYMGGSMGKVKESLIKKGLEIIEKEEKSTEENEDEEHQTKLKRARDLVQNLQE